MARPQGLFVFRGHHIEKRKDARTMGMTYARLCVTEIKIASDFGSVLSGLYTHYGEITTMLARLPFSSDLLNFGTKTIQINNSPNTFISDTGEQKIPGLIDALIIL